MCLIENQGGKHGDHQIQELHAAYQSALKRLKEANGDADIKKELLKNQMTQLIE